MVSNKPRTVTAVTQQVWFMCTDACFDMSAGTGGLGGVLVDPQGSPVSWFCHSMDSHFCQQYMREEQQHAIGELESLAVLAGLRLWQVQLESKHCVCFIDNQGSRFAILKGYSSNVTISKVAERIAF